MARKPSFEQAIRDSDKNGDGRLCIKIIPNDGGPPQFDPAFVYLDNKSRVPWALFTVLVWPFVHVVRLSSRGPPVVVLPSIQRPYAVPGLRAALVCAGAALRVVRLRHVDLARVGSTVPGTTVRGIPVAAAATIMATSFLVRLPFPARSQQVLDLQLWWWPQCAGMFCLRALVSGQRWVERVTANLAR